MRRVIRQQVAILKALASEPRLEIMRLLRKHPQCVNALAIHLGMSQPAVSQHLRALKEAGLVKAEKRGIWMHYAINLETIEQHGRGMAQIFGGWIEIAEPVDGRRGCPSGLLEVCQSRAARAKARHRR